MKSDIALHGITKALHTQGLGSGRDIIANTSLHVGVLLASNLTTANLIELINSFESALYVSIRNLLKSKRSDYAMTQENMTDADQPVFFTGFWTTGSSVKHGGSRYVFSIAKTPELRIAAGLSGGGPRSKDYTSFPNEKLLSLPWEEKQAIIDRAIGQNWITLQSSINDSAKDFGVKLPDLHKILSECKRPNKFLKHIINIARPENITGEVSPRQHNYLLWCFLAYLRQKGILLLPLRSYYISFFSASYIRYDHGVVFSSRQLQALDKLWEATQSYSEQNRNRMMKIAQTVFLSADIQTLGDISPDLFIAISNSLVGDGSSPTYREKFIDLTQNTYDFLSGFWNDSQPIQPISPLAGKAFRLTENRRQSSATPSGGVRRRHNPFWFADVPDDEWNIGHPIPGYKINKAVQSWAVILRQAFPHIKVKDPSRFRIAGTLWLSYINELETPPITLREVSRNMHINDPLFLSNNTFRYKLAHSHHTPAVKNDLLSSLAQMFGIYIRIHSLDIKNPIEFDLDKFMTPSTRGKTPRTPLSPEMLIFLKEFNSRGDFEFSKSLKPLSWTTEETNILRHFRRVIDPEDGIQKIAWWPALAILMDLMLTLPLRGSQARWLDTGEGDEYSIDLSTLQETFNPLPFSVKGRQMGIFTTFAKGLETSERLLGLRITTNKRRVGSDGRFEIPWCPNDLRDNISMLISWQRKYNPITEPVRAERDYWVTQLRNEEITNLIPTIFSLFRDPGSENGAFPPTYQQVQTYWNLLCTAAEDELKATKNTRFRLTRDRVRNRDKKPITERVALFDMHTLRVSGITAMIEAGVPPDLVQEIVGHAAIVMTLYYHKLHPGQVNRALTDAFESRELSLERIPEILENLDSYDSFLVNNRAPEDALGQQMLKSAVGNGTYQILSHGICPGGDCLTGGEYEHSLKEHLPVPRAGACSLCRYRVTGPMFLAGLVVNANKIMSELFEKGQEIARLNDEIRHLRHLNKFTIPFESRREVAYRELENLWQEWAAEQQYVENSSKLLDEYLTQQEPRAGNLPILASEGSLSKIRVKSEHHHPFHLHQLLSEASEYIPSERHANSINLRDTFLNEMLANNKIDPFLLRLDTKTRLHAGNLLGTLLADMVPDSLLQDVHDGKHSLANFIGLEESIGKLAKTHTSSSAIPDETRSLKNKELPDTDE